MKPNVWNIRDALNIPLSMGAKSGKSGATSDYSSLTDSQFLFGSQFWPENSQSFSQDISVPSKSSQHTSQEINEMKVSTSYKSKPLLFGDGIATHSTGGNVMGLLDRFEEEKRKAKESEILTQGIRQLHESLENIKMTFLNSFDGNCDIIRKAVAEGVEGLRKAICDDLDRIKESISSKNEILMNLLSKNHTEMKDIESKASLAITDLSTIVLNLKRDMESLRTEQNKEQNVLGEIMSLLSTKMTTHLSGGRTSDVRMIDNTVQTSPGLTERFCIISGEKCYYERMRVCSEGINHPEERSNKHLDPVKAKCLDKLSTGKSLQMLDPLPIDKPQTFNHTAVEMSEPSIQQKTYYTRTVMSGASSSTVVTGVIQAPRSSNMVGTSVLVEPLKSLCNTDEDGSANWTEISRQKKVPKRGRRIQPFRRKKRALILPQRRSTTTSRMGLVNVFDDSQYDKEQENRVPLSTVSVYKTNNKVVLENHIPPQQQWPISSESEQCLNPWSWSQSSNSSQVLMECHKAEWEEAKPEHNADAISNQRGIWQLFDFISDSD
ncbi:interactor of HORMAD1 protein 1 isoform X2 [Brachyhypopomus gauderio]